MEYKLDKLTLLKDLYVAFFDARKHKTTKPYVRRFEENLKENLEELCNSLMDRTYKPLPSRCFIIEHPKKREVFAAQFRDRVVHHLYYNYTHELFERTFIQDTYSCIKNRGTHYGIKRLTSHIRKESNNYTVPCYIMKLDIRGYFMHINRSILLQIAERSIQKMLSHRINKRCPKTWGDILDVDFVLWLTKEMIMLDPRINCEIIGSTKNWEGLDESKSLFNTDSSCGIPIGNLTSLLFSNVYMNVFDLFVKRILKFRHYGRYVDDAYVISKNKVRLLSIVDGIDLFLSSSLALSLHMGKLKLHKNRYGVEFLGAYVKPYRTYISNLALRRIKVGIQKFNFSDFESVFRSVNSYLGVLIHYSSYNLRKLIFLKEKFLGVALYNYNISKMEIKTISKYV